MKGQRKNGKVYLVGAGPGDPELLTLKGRRALLLVEHDMDAVFRLADQVSVLVAGRVIATGTPAEVRDNPDVRQAYLGDEWALIA